MTKRYVEIDDVEKELFNWLSPALGKDYIGVELPSLKPLTLTEIIDREHPDAVDKIANTIRRYTPTSKIPTCELAEKIIAILKGEGK